MVPPDRIELSTSPLPRVRSTPELRRHIYVAAGCESGRNMPHDFHKRKRLDANFLDGHPVRTRQPAVNAQNMNENKNKSATKGPKSSDKSERQERLNEALRENLKKRKAQARARKSIPKAPKSA